MIDFEPQGEDIFDILSDEVKETTVTETKGALTIIRVDPAKVVRLIRALQENGVNQIRYRGGGIRKLDPELARRFAQAAKDILGYTIEELDRLGLPLTTASNWGSTTTGLVTPKSDVEVLFGVPSIYDLETAGQVLRHDTDFQNRLWGLRTPVRIPSVTFSLTVPSIYEQHPGEKYIPSANDTITFKHP